MILCRLFILCLACLSLFLCSASAVSARVFYVSAKGDDGNTGLSMATPWKTVERANQTVFSAGDQILFEGGEVFSGPLKLDHADQGSEDKPIIISSYRLDRGRATIKAGEGRGIDVHNASGLRISELRIVGDGWDDNKKSGILLLSTLEEGAEHVAIDRVEIIGFGKHGISIGAWNTKSGYRDVKITHCTIHHNLRTGVLTWGPWGSGIYAHRRIYIGDSRAYKMKGGSGLTFSSVDGGTIERCIAYENGEEFSGGAGIWAWDSNDILFQFNESYANRTIGVDGDGFDFDGGVTNSVMQYNYSHDNDAAGFLLAQYQYAPQAMDNIVVRFNISENDCRKKPYGAIHVWNGDTGDRIRNVHIYQNTVYLSPAASSKGNLLTRKIMAGMEALGLVASRDVPSAIAVISPTTSVSVYNNLFFTTGGERLVSVVKGQQTLQFHSNAYWADNHAFDVQWMGGNFASLDDWLEEASDQERLDDRILAIFSDPMLVAPGTGGTLGQADLLSTLEGYKLQQGSPLAGRGLNILETFGIDPGNRGFFGVPQLETAPPAIGAHLAHEG